MDCVLVTTTTHIKTRLAVRPSRRHSYSIPLLKIDQTVSTPGCLVLSCLSGQILELLRYRRYPAQRLMNYKKWAAWRAQAVHLHGSRHQHMRHHQLDSRNPRNATLSQRTDMTVVVSSAQLHDEAAGMAMKARHHIAVTI